MKHLSPIDFAKQESNLPFQNTHLKLTNTWQRKEQ